MSRPAAPEYLLQGDLWLRPWRQEEAPTLVALLRTSMDSVGRWMSWCTPAYSLDDAQHWIDTAQKSWRGQGDEYALAVAIRGGEQPIGCIGINQLRADSRMANLGYWLAAPYQKQGLMVPAARLLAGYAFSHFDVQRLEIVVAEGNWPSRRTAEKCGARFEGIARRRLWIHDLPHDAAIYALLPEDLDQPAAAHHRAISS